jgi:Domain of unknown function (DUF1707)
MSDAAPPAPRAPAAEADRERVVALLGEHFAQGRLDSAELDRRVGAALAAEFTDEAAAALDGLPPLVPSGAPARRPRRRAHGQSATPGPGWVPTQERFRDPTSRVVMRVWIDPADQSRHYVPEPGD